MRPQPLLNRVGEMKGIPPMKVRLLGLASLCFSIALLVLFISSKTQSQGDKSGGEDGLSQAEQDLLNEINQARAHPDVYAKYLQSLKPFFKGKDYQPNGQPALTTQEGWNAVQDGINFLSRAKPQGLQRSAPAHPPTRQTITRPANQTKLRLLQSSR